MPYTPKDTEPEIQEFWKADKVYEQAKQANTGKKRFYYLDGPPYTSGKIHIGHAWGKALRDMAMRHLRMRGLDVWDRPGFDMHGLPTAHKVMAKHHLKSKEDIGAFGDAKFTEECKSFALENMAQMIQDFKRLGIWMDWDRPYTPLSREFMDGTWWLIKQAEKNGVLYEGEKSMAWCRECATSLAKHELEYENITDTSIFVKLRVEGKEKEHLIVWTTTPWTIPFNMAVMVHPELDYVRAQVDDEVWVVAKGLAGPVITAVADRTFTVLEEMKGSQLQGTRYIHPFGELAWHKEQHEQNPKAHSVVMSSEHVSLDAGSGLVHCAPGCGPEDFEVGHREGIPPFNNLDQYGVYPEGMGELSGLVAKRDDKKFIAIMEERGIILAKTPVEHEYPHCWRCKNPVIWKTTRQWFFDVEKQLRDLMLQENEKITWVPDWAGRKWFRSWLENLRDNGITRQISWGTPLPIWRCDACKKHEIIGSSAKLQEKAGELPPDLHKPYIDTVSWKCDCGGSMKRLPDVLDVWIDAGTTSWTCLDYPSKTEDFEALFPADLILEGKDQIRGWFNLLLVASMVAMKKPSYKAVYMHGFVNDSKSRKMSKSLGNIISPYEVIDQYGADTLRYYSIGSANPGLDLNYNQDDMKTKFRNLQVLWNLHRFIIDLADSTGLMPGPEGTRALEEQFITSRLHSTIKQVTFLYDSYEYSQVPWACEALLMDLSRTYIQLVRDKAHQGSADEQQAVVSTAFTVLKELLRLYAPMTPFLAEELWQALRQRFALPEASVHLAGWPAHNNELIDEKLEERVGMLERMVSAIHSARERKGIGRRWPLGRVIAITDEPAVQKALQDLQPLVLGQCNLKAMDIVSSLPDVKVKVLGNYEAMEKDFPGLAPMLIGQLAFNSPESIVNSVKKFGWFTVSAGGKSYQLKKEHLIMERIFSPHLEDASIDGLSLFLDTRQDSALEAEGYARELARRVQALRKKAGLQRTDKINCFVKTDEDLAEMLEPHLGDISAKVGAEHLRVKAGVPAKAYPHVAEEKVKDKTFSIMIEKHG